MDVVVVGMTVGVAGLEAFGFDPGDFELEVVGEGSVDEGFFEGLVGVFVLDVFAYDADGDFVEGMVGAVDEVLPEVRSGVGVSMRRYLRARVSTPSAEKVSGTS